ncbi:hypothetical protein FQA47_015450 [Oryzias melastigma]|uniref:Uncharacterized protein n=1 Tax=Oryzias melastigma TaxID=30732 RepID=A0A834FQ44_ORYME|nr:hypothetical protein FQA47_015450 [Oryzias melastigma]
MLDPPDPRERSGSGSGFHLWIPPVRISCWTLNSMTPRDGAPSKHWSLLIGPRLTVTACLWLIDV